MISSNAVITSAHHALKAARGWVLTCIESTTAKRDLRLLDQALIGLDNYRRLVCFDNENTIDSVALVAAQDVCDRLNITHPQQIAKIQLVITDAIKISHPLSEER
jgi:hypothetical protein